MTGITREGCSWCAAPGPQESRAVMANLLYTEWLNGNPKLIYVIQSAKAI